MTGSAWRYPAAILVVALALWAMARPNVDDLPLTVGQRPGLPHMAMKPGPRSFQPIVALPRAQPPITVIPFVDVTEANRTLRDSELVIGVTVGGISRAYPINILTGPQREILNDTLGGVPIAATW